LHCSSDKEPKQSIHCPETGVTAVFFKYNYHLFFYANEGNEPIHVHCRKAGMECKFWLEVDSFDIREEYAYGLSPADRRTLRGLIFEHFDYIIVTWVDVHKRQP